MKYMIYNILADFEIKNSEISESEICGNAKEYANAQSCKHPILGKWAMPVLHFATNFFNESELVEELTSDWKPLLNKPNND